MKLINKIKNIILLIAVVLMMVPGDVIKAASNTITTGDSTTILSYIGYSGNETKFAMKYLEDQKTLVYCLNHKLKTPISGLTYTKQEEVTNQYPGIIYILQNGYPTKKKASKYLTGNAKKDYYITQGAIHWYMDRKNGISDNAAQGTKTNQQLGVGFKKNAPDPYNLRPYIKALVEDAIKATNGVTYNASVDIDLTNESDIMTLDDGKWVSQKFSISTNGNTTGVYKISFTDVPSGFDVKVYDINNNEITDLNGNTNDEFIVKVQVPTGVTDTNLSFKVHVSTTGTKISAYRYTASDKKLRNTYQDIAVIDSRTENKSASYELNIGEESYKIKMGKVDKDNTNLYLKGAKLKYSGTTSSGKAVSGIFTTKDTGPTEISLRPGTYQLEEVNPPQKYKYTSSKVNFKVDVSGTILDANDNVLGNQDTVVLKLKNEKNKIQITKTDKDGRNYLPGATLALYKVKSSSSDEDTASNVQIDDDWNTSTVNPQTFNGLEPGWYMVVEKEAPEGYAKADPEYFYVNSKGQILDDEQDDTISIVKLKNYMTLTKISKTDITGTKEIKDAHLEVYCGDDPEPKHSWKSGTTPHEIPGLPAGASCRLVETIAPYGYAISNSVPFEVNEDGSVTMVEMRDELLTLKISKQDITTHEELPKAYLVIRNENGEIVDDWESTNEKHEIEIIKMPPGKYTLEETTSPAGYMINTETITFYLDEHGKVSVDGIDDFEGNEIIMYNTPETPVPKTAANISVFVYLIGIFAISGGAYLLYNKKKLNK